MSLYKHLLTAYAHVRTEPQSDIGQTRRKEKKTRFVFVPLRFASEAWPRAGLGEPRSASNANKPASSWPLKQGRKSAQNMDLNELQK